MFYDNLKAICDKKNIKITPLILECGGTKGVIGGWKKGASPNSDIVMKLSVRLNVPTDQLLFGDDKNLSGDKLSDDEQNLLEHFRKLSERSKGIILGRVEQLIELEVKTTQKIEETAHKKHLKINCSTYQVSAGTGFELGEGDEWYEIEVPDTFEARKADFALKIKGNSMEPIYFDGDIVLVKKQPSVDFGEIGIFNIEGNGYIKKFGGSRLISLNAEYDDIHISDYDEERIYCFGKVIGRI